MREREREREREEVAYTFKEQHYRPVRLVCKTDLYTSILVHSAKEYQ